jgi:hypothetical protein
MGCRQMKAVPSIASEGSPPERHADRVLIILVAIIEDWRR